MKVKVVAGFYKDFSAVPDNETVIYDLAQMPRIGDQIAVNAQLSKIMAQRSKDWGFTKGTHLNYVKRIIHCDGQVPVIISIGSNPKYILIDYYYKEKFISMVLPSVPAVGDLVYDAEISENTLYVSEVCHQEQSIVVVLDKEPVVQNVNVTNDSITVDGGGRYPLDVNITNNSICVEAGRHPIDVKVDNSYIYTKNYDSYGD